MAKDEQDGIAAALDTLAEIARAQAAQTSTLAKQNAPKSLEVGQIARASAFNPRGEKTYPLPPLQCDIYAPWPLFKHGHGCTREEVQLFNLLKPGTYAFTLNDGEPATMNVVGRTNEATGAIEELHLQPVPLWTNEHKQRFPSMALLLRELLESAGVDTRSISTMKQEKAAIAKGELAVSISEA